MTISCSPIAKLHIRDTHEIESSRGLTEELQGGVPHRPAGRTEQSERQDGYSGRKLKDGCPQTRTTNEGLKSVNRTHLQRDG